MKIIDLQMQTATVTSTATITLGPAVSGYRTVAQAIAAGNLIAGDTGVPFYVRDPATGAYEAGYYTITSETTLTRERIARSSNSNAAVSFGGAACEVYCSLPPDYLAGLPGVRTLSTLSQSVPLDMAGTTYMPSTTVAGALAFSPAASPVQGALVYVRLTADGANTPTFSGMKEWNGSSGYDNRSGVVNVVQFFYDGADTWYSIAQAVGATAATATATVSSVTVSPSTASVGGGGAQTFTATVAGTNSPTQSVTWSATAGSITSGGVFTAPAATGSTQTITVTATSTLDGTKSGTATVTVAASAATVSGVTVSPSTASVSGGGTQQFTATVAGTNSPAQTVTWSATAGSITTGGLFTAPAATGSSQTVTVTATSTVDGTKSGTATVTVAALTAPGAPTIGTATAGDGYVDVAFTAPASNGGAAITSYTATLSTGETATGTASPIRVTAANGTARTAHVTATNSVGTGAASAESNSVTPAVVDYPRLASLVTMTESGTGPYTYTGAGAAITDTTGGCSTKSLAAGVDGWMNFKVATTNEIMAGFRISSGVGTWSSLRLGVWAKGNASGVPTYYTRVSDGTNSGNTNAGGITPQAGDTLRIARVGNVLKIQVARAATPTTFLDIETKDITSAPQLWVQCIASNTAALQLLSWSGFA